MEKDDETYAEGGTAYDFGARIYSSRLGRWMSVDPLFADNSEYSPYSSMDNNPVYLIDPDGMDAEVSIKNKTITVSVQIYIYGADASKEQAEIIHTSIMKKWAKKEWKYEDENGDVYDVVFDVNVDLYDEEDPTNVPLIIPDAWNPSSTNNYIEVDEEVDRSFVRGGDAGEWGTKRRAAYAHELGHLLGLDDRYTDEDGPDKGWEYNIMGESLAPVDQRNINGVVKDAVNDYNNSKEKKENKEFKTKIDDASPSN